jgi:hypothetical protein
MGEGREKAGTNGPRQGKPNENIGAAQLLQSIGTFDSTQRNSKPEP